MSYFQNTKYVPYKFGNEQYYLLHQDLSMYVDLIDQVRDNGSFYAKHTILDHDRPDNLSQRLYGSVKYYWTFFLMNDKLREFGWPLSNQEIRALAIKENSNTVVTTQDDLTGIFKVGTTVTGQTTGVTGTIIKRRLDMGQLVIEGLKDFKSTELLSDGTNTITLTASAYQYDATHHYKNASGEIVDINPYSGAGSELVPVTWYEKYLDHNNSLKDIIVIKPEVIDTVFEQFQSAIING